MKDLAKMPKLKALLEDEEHCFDSTYAFDLHDCGDPSCQFGCSDWRTEFKAEAAGHGYEPVKVEAAVQLLERRSVLPMATKNGDMFMPYHEASQLPMTDERDLPSRAATLAGTKKTEVRKRQEAADKAKTTKVGERIFHVSKVSPPPPPPCVGYHPHHHHPSPSPLSITIHYFTLDPRCATSSSATTANGRACALLAVEAVGGLAQEHGRVRLGHLVHMRRPAV